MARRRRTTVQYLVLLSLLAVSVHLYFNWHADPFSLDHTLDLSPERYRDPPPPPPQPPLPGQRKTGAQAPREKSMLTADVRKRDAVVDAFRHAWSAYETDALGYDEYHPISHRGSNLGSGGGIGYTVVDALDTMLLMGLDSEYKTARTWVATELTFDRNGYFSTFETTIRVLGGLLSAHHLSGGDPLYLTLATDLGTRILPALQYAVPASHVDLAASGRGTAGAGHATIAEFTTLQLEFRYLAHLVAASSTPAQGEKFWRPVERVMRTVARSMRSLWAADSSKESREGLAPIDVNGRGEFARSTIRMGSNGDSYYEYLLKQYLQTNKTDPAFRDMYATAMRAVRAHLIKRVPSSSPSHDHDAPAAYIAELLPGAERGRGEWVGTWSPQNKQEHLSCFLAGSLMLGATTLHSNIAHVSRPPREGELTPEGWADWEAGREVLEGCVSTLRTKTGLAPEGFNFRNAEEGEGVDGRWWYIKDHGREGSPPYDARYMLRPEISESLFLAYRLTGDPRYRAYAWDLFSAIERHCRLPGGGYATVLDVDALPVSWEDKQETFFLSETLKYLFLIFADESVLDLERVVFNTEAHPLPVFDPVIRSEFVEY